MNVFVSLFARLFYPLTIFVYHIKCTIAYVVLKLFPNNSTAKVSYINLKKKSGYANSINCPYRYFNFYVIFSNLIVYNIICRLLKLNNGKLYFIVAAIICFLSCFYKDDGDSVEAYCKAFHLKPKIYKLVSCAMAYIIIALEIYLAFITNPLIK